MSQNNLRELQLVELDMLKQVISLCEKHNLTYYALGGTLLGAVRHKGFIPWDDDVDIGMPRPDYERFLSIVSNELPPNYEISHFKTKHDEKRPVYACQLIHNKTKLIQHIANQEIYTHVWIDIFPLDGMPNCWLLRKLHSLCLLYRRMRIQFSMFDENVHQHRVNRPWYEKLLIKLYRTTHVGSKSNPYTMMYLMDRALQHYSYETSKYLVNFMGAWKLKELFPKSVYGDGKFYPFENILIRGPQDADYVLKQMYGDYMIPVCKVEQRDHHKIQIVKL